MYHISGNFLLEPSFLCHIQVMAQLPRQLSCHGKREQNLQYALINYFGVLAGSLDVQNPRQNRYDTWSMILGSRIDQSNESHNETILYPTLHHSEQKCEHFYSEWYCGIWHKCFVVFVIWSILMTPSDQNCAHATGAELPQHMRNSDLQLTHSTI